MAKANATEKNQKPVNPDNAFQPGKTVGIEEGFASLGLDRLWYKPELCFKVNPRIRGFLIEAQGFVHEKFGPFTALVFRLTEETAVVNGDGPEAQIVTAYPGDEIMIVATEKLQKLIQYANHPTEMAEFIVNCLGEMPLKADQTMWRYHVQGAQPVSRDNAALQAFAQLAASAGVPQVGNGQGAPLSNQA